MALASTRQVYSGGKRNSLAALPVAQVHNHECIRRGKGMELGLQLNSATTFERRLDLRLSVLLVGNSPTVISIVLS